MPVMEVLTREPCFEGPGEGPILWKLTMAVGDILKANGVNVLYTRTSDIYQTPFEKARNCQ